MTEEEIIALVDQGFEELPAFLKSEDHTGRGAFQLQIDVQERLPFAHDDPKFTKVQALVVGRIQELFGFPPTTEASEVVTHPPCAGSDRPLDEAELKKKIIFETMDHFNGTSDGTLVMAQLKKERALQTLAKHLNEHFSTSCATQTVHPQPIEIRNYRND